MFRKSIKKIQFFALLSLSALLTSACGNLGIGVILWPPPNSDWVSGQTVKVRDSSYIRNTYIVDLPGQRKLKDEMEKWRLRIFDKSAEAEIYASTLVPWADVYAECLYQGLPMRERPSNLSEQIYRFRQGDLVKILTRDEKPAQVGNLYGYWYKGLSDGGIEGYIFDYYLNIVSIKDGKRSAIDKNSL